MDNGVVTFAFVDANKNVYVGGFVSVNSGTIEECYRIDIQKLEKANETILTTEEVTCADNIKIIN